MLLFLVLAVGTVLIVGTFTVFFPILPWLGRHAPPQPATSAGAGLSEPSEPVQDAQATQGSTRSAAADGDRSGSASLDLRFRGRGEIRGHVEVSDDTPFPREWQLVLRPSTSLVGRELAEERVLEFTGGEQDFVARDLPLAGYDVLAQAAGMNGLVQPILLDTLNTSPFVNLRLVPAGVLEGKVLDAEGLPAEGVTLTLVPLEGEPLVAVTDALGFYRFPQVLDGPHELIVGTRDFPLVSPPSKLAFRAPSLTMPRIELPPLASLDLAVVDELGNRIEGAEIAGSSPTGGTFPGTTDATGRIVLHHLLAGRWRITLAHEGHKSRRVTVDLAAGETEALTVQLFP